ncbi:MAG: polyhydroxybutyrate depolymerase [Gammaproteobacteria bacterium]|nr:polyhydroxybutyrate depolymerase [Gammaproteobacteria bacterium]
MRCTAAVAALLLTSNVFAEPTEVVIHSGGRERYYYLYVPKSIDPSLPAPVVLLLHGSYTHPAAFLPYWMADADREGIILAAPKSTDTYGWRIRDDSPTLMRDVIDDVAAKHPVDRRRLYLFGSSSGAVHALTVGVLESQYFAAVAIHAGSWRDKSSFKALEFARRKIPVWIAVGTLDEFFSIRSVRDTEAALRSAGHPVEVVIIKGHHHSYDEVVSRVNADAWKFLAPVELTEAPVFQSYP